MLNDTKTVYALIIGAQSNPMTDIPCISFANTYIELQFDVIHLLLHSM